jgi:hypothetical protein
VHFNALGEKLILASLICRRRHPFLHIKFYEIKLFPPPCTAPRTVGGGLMGGKGGESDEIYAKKGIRMWRKGKGETLRREGNKKRRQSFFVPATSLNADETSLWYVAQHFNIATTHAPCPMLPTVGMLENIKRMKTQNGFLCGTISLILEVEYVKRALSMPHTKTGVKCWRGKS